MTERTDLTLPWRSGRSSSALTDRAVLQRINDDGVASITAISESRRSKSQLRLQCRYMTKAGLLSRVGNESYTVSVEGRAFLEDESRVPHRDGYLSLSDILELLDKRISDFTGVTQEYIKQRNYDYYEVARDPYRDSEQEYSVNARDPRQERRKVLSARKWKLDRLMRELPRTEPAASQCAHWVTSIAGLHLFPDANHRTAMVTLYALALDNEIIGEDHRWPGTQTEIGKAVLLSKYHRYLAPRLNFDRLWRRDTLYWHWYQYFEYLLHDVDYPSLNNHSEGKLRRKLRKVRGKDG